MTGIFILMSGPDEPPLLVTEDDVEETGAETLEYGGDTYRRSKKQPDQTGEFPVYWKDP